MIACEQNGNGKPRPTEPEYVLAPDEVQLLTLYGNLPKHQRRVVLAVLSMAPLLEQLGEELVALVNNTDEVPTDGSH
jgi:hypothetical protein